VVNDEMNWASRETRIPIKGVRKATAAAMTKSAIHRAARDGMARRPRHQDHGNGKRLNGDRDWQGVRLTPLAFVASAFLLMVTATSVDP
jgi:2-oxoisovalerate dehydrogenase E2 component (dihydrolipoyl transacylase)